MTTASRDERSSPAPVEIEECVELAVFHDLVRFETRLWNAVEACLAQTHGLTVARFEVMRVIGRRPACRVNDIADELVITWGGASKLVDRLEAAALCRRRPNPDDGRSSLIELTSLGERQLRDAAQIVQDELRARFDGILTPHAFAQFGTALRKLKTAAADWDEGRRAG